MERERPVSEPGERELPSPASGERDDHHEAPPGVAIPGDEDEPPSPEEQRRERGDE